MSPRDEPLAEYHRKRRFRETPEPEGALAPAPADDEGLLVIQKHRASHLHYDLRLELDGVLKSWAVPKGPSLDPKLRRLAMQVEDHPLDYQDFEGVIPEGNYGAGEVIVWDRGRWRWSPSDETRAKYRTARRALERGKLDFTVESAKLSGRFVLARAGGKSSDARAWMLLKTKDAGARPGSDIATERPESVVTGRRIEELRDEAAPGEARWHSDVGLERPRAKRTPAVKKLLGKHAKLAREGEPPASLEPMLPSLVEKPPEEHAREEWLFELKLDGVRALAWKEGESVRLVSRRGNALEGAFPEVARAIARLPVERCVLDGEICRHDTEGRTRFQLLQNRIHVTSPTTRERLAREEPATFYAFDALFVNGLDLRAVPLETRKKLVHALVPEEDERLRYVEHVAKRGHDLLALVCQKGLEGLVAKRAGSAYASGRSRLWLKVKCGTVGAFVVGGFTIYKTTGARSLGGLLLGLHSPEGELIPVGGVGTGFDEATRRALREKLEPLAQRESPFSKSAGPGASWRTGPKPEKIVWVRPELVCECRYTELTDDRKLRAPSFLGLVARDPRTCTLPDEAVLTEKPIAVEGPRPKLTNLDKVFFPEDGITKGDLVQFYEMVAPVLLPHLRERPMVLVRYPNGIHGQAFYQKNAGTEKPEWARTERIWSRESRRWVRYLVVGSVGELLHCIQLGAISLSPWSSRVGSLENPDFSIVDLDPGDDCPFEHVIEVARAVKVVLDEIGLRGYCKTSGATGLHVEVPLEPRYDYDQARMLAEIVATIVHARRPDITTLVRGLRERPGDKVYIDYLQNAIGKTVVGPYSVRERPRAPVSTPLRWEEVRRGLKRDRFHIGNFAARLAAVGDLWKPVLEDKQAIEGALAKLEELARGSGATPAPRARARGRRKRAA